MATRRALPGAGDEADKPTQQSARRPLPGAGDDADKPTPPPPPRAPLPGAGDEADKPTPALAVPIVARNRSETDKAGEETARQQRVAPPSTVDRAAVARSAAIRTRERELKAEITGQQAAEDRRRTEQRRRNNAVIANSLSEFTRRDDQVIQRLALNRTAFKNLKSAETKLRNDEVLTLAEASAVAWAFDKDVSKILGVKVGGRELPGDLAQMRWRARPEELANRPVEIRVGRLPRVGRPPVTVRIAPSVQRDVMRAVRAAERRASTTARRRRTAIRSNRPALAERRRLQQRTRTARQKHAELQRARAEVREARAAGDPALLARSLAATQAALKADSAVAVQATRVAIVSPGALSGVKPGSDVFVRVIPQPTGADTVRVTAGGQTRTLPKVTPAAKPKPATQLVSPPGPKPGPRPTPAPRPAPIPAASASPVRSVKLPAPTRPTARPVPGAALPTTPKRQPAASTPKPAAVAPPPIKGSDTPADDLRRDNYPAVVQWRQGSKYVQLDLTNGRRTTTDRPIGRGVKAGTTPAQTLRVIKARPTRPTIRRFRLGVVDAEVGLGKIEFQANKQQSFTTNRERGFEDRKQASFR